MREGAVVGVVDVSVLMVSRPKELAVGYIYDSKGFE